jgi:hypothetical protein
MKPAIVAPSETHPTPSAQIGATLRQWEAGEINPSDQVGGLLLAVRERNELLSATRQHIKIRFTPRVQGFHVDFWLDGQPKGYAEMEHRDAHAALGLFVARNAHALGLEVENV